MPADRGIGLAEGLEQSLDAIGGDADAGVGHRKAQFAAQAIAWSGADCGAYLAGRGELDGVRQQIDQHLTQAGHVGDDLGRHARTHPVDQFQILGGGGGRDQVQGILKAGAQVKGRVFQFHPARFDLGKIENVVDQRQQGIAGQADGFDEILLFRIEWGIEQQAGHADYRVHRGADLVAHVGQEFALGAVGGFGDILGLLQGPCRFLALADIMQDAGEAWAISAGYLADR